MVEAKRKNIDVSGALQQAKRYSRSFTPTSETLLTAENWGVDAAYRIPFAFSSNGRPFLRQLATKSGIWFCDLRHSDNLGHPLDGWYTPEGLTALIKRDEASAHTQLATTPFNYGFLLRYYQQDAIRAAEQAIEHGQREMLLAMATGTGKTKTCIALIYRLLKAKRFRRILFLVDRSALGEQAANAFKDICDYLATELDPASRQKTLIFCVTDAHADMVVNLLKKAFATQYGSLDIAWLKDDNATDAQDLPEPALLAQEAMGELEGAMEELRGILEELGEELVE